MREEDRRSGLALGCIESARKLDLSVGRAGRETWFDVVTGPVRYRASTSWSPATAIGVIALIDFRATGASVSAVWALS